MFIVIVLYSGDIEFVKMCVDDDHARNELADWCCENWHDEDTCYEDFSTNDVIEWYFDTYEDYSYYRQPIVPAVTPFGEQAPTGDDILLTPGRCRIIREAVGGFDFGIAQIIVTEEEEQDLGNGEQAIHALIQQFS